MTPTHRDTEQGLEIRESHEWYDGPRRAHRQIFFHVYRDGRFVESFKRRAQAERFIKRQENN